MSIHIDASPGDIAEHVVLVGDPLRAQHIAQQYLKNPVCYNQIRGAFGYTGTYNAQRISVQAVGMGMPSISIYINELAEEYGVKRMVRAGTACALQPELPLGDVVLAMGACTDSNLYHALFPNTSFAALPSYHLLTHAAQCSQDKGLSIHIGNVMTSDTFACDDIPSLPSLQQHGVLALEMEVAALYTLAAHHQIERLAILTLSDHAHTKESSTPEARQTAFTAMMELALDCVTV